jgi:iron complex outermembrane receptor protein
MRRTFLHRIVLSAFVFLFVNSNCFSQNGTITGTVKYGKEILHDATVSLGDKVKLTDKHGEFSFSVKPGNYTLVITHAGYEKVEQVITVDADGKENFDFDLVANEQLGEIVLLGSRSLAHRSNLSTPVPVDAFSSTQLLQTGQTNLIQMLNFTAPSFNASMQIAHEPITLRGLNPDQTLFLLNGTRYNNMAYINTGDPRGQLGKGSVSNDLNSIPFAAIEKIEILRDGASAQYGSDAIAGVVNIQLKEETNKTSLNFHLGQYYKGDGENVDLSIYRGISLNKKGFFSYSADFRFRNPTFRGGEYKGTVYTDNKVKDDSIIKARGFDRMKVSNQGGSQLVSFGILMNGGYPINNKTEIFWTGALNYLTFVFVVPYAFPKISSQVNVKLFPDGFKGIIEPNIWNVSGILGAKGITGKGIHWEFSNAYGMNDDQYISRNTNNASQEITLGKNAPTTFYTGTLVYRQLTNTIHFTKNIVKLANKLKTINLGWGAELRLENFQMKAGEEASWKNYDTVLRKKNGGAYFSYIVSPDNALNKNRSVICGYADIETDVGDRFLLDIASRFEHYSDFGGNLAGKLAARYKFLDKLSLRGSVSNGFRAPSLQEYYYGAVNAVVPSGNAVPPIRGIFNNEHKVTKLFGVPPLQAEKSVNLGGGMTSTISKHIYLTIDYYWIQIKDRIVLSGRFDRKTNPEVDSLLKDSSIGDYSHVDRLQFFANAINTRTQGIDAVFHGNWNLHKAKLIADLSANFTKTRLFGEIKTASHLSATEENKNTLFDISEKSKVENGQPQSKIIFSLNYKKEKIGFMLRNTRFGKTSSIGIILIPPVDTVYDFFSAKILTDLSINYSPKRWLTLTAGANNLFDIYPDRLKNYRNTNEGIYVYSMWASPFGFNGGYYFVNMSLNF